MMQESADDVLKPQPSTTAGHDFNLSYFCKSTDFADCKTMK
jgi:hypothetical protein